MKPKTRLLHISKIPSVILFPNNLFIAGSFVIFEFTKVRLSSKEYILLSIDEKRPEKSSFRDCRIDSTKLKFSKIPPYESNVFIKAKTRSTQRIKP